MRAAASGSTATNTPRAKPLCSQGDSGDNRPLWSCPYPRAPWLLPPLTTSELPTPRAFKLLLLDTGFQSRPLVSPAVPGWAHRQPRPGGHRGWLRPVCISTPAHLQPSFPRLAGTKAGSPPQHAPAQAHLVVPAAHTELATHAVAGRTVIDAHAVLQGDSSSGGGGRSQPRLTTLTRALRKPGPRGREVTGSDVCILKDTKGQAAPEEEGMRAGEDTQPLRHREIARGALDEEPKERGGGRGGQRRGAERKGW